MKLEIEIPDKYGDRLEEAEELRPGAREHLLTSLETQAMQQIMDMRSQARRSPPPDSEEASR